MTLSLEARQIHNHILDNSGTSDYWIRAAGAAIKRGRWRVGLQSRSSGRIFRLLPTSSKSNLVDNFQTPLGATGGKLQIGSLE
jgi:hypothetical protein